MSVYTPILSSDCLGSSYVTINDNFAALQLEINALSAVGVSGFSGYSGLTGATGSSGYSGLNGSAGSSGFSGYSGANGSAGSSGFSGYSGSNGSAGSSGYSGYSGSNGTTGTSGFSGYSGSNGSAGSSGYSGYSGVNGTTGASGFSGAVGTTGASGYSGAVGATGVSGYSGFSGYSGSGVSGFSGWSGVPAVGITYYLTNSASDVSSHEILDLVPDNDPETYFSVTVTNAVASATFIDQITPTGQPGTTQIPLGTWQFNTWYYVSVASIVTLVINVYKYNGTTQTLLFSAVTDPLINTDINNPARDVTTYTVVNSISLSSTDRIMVEYAAANSTGTSADVRVYYEGTDHYTNISTGIYRGATGTSGYSGYSGVGVSGYSGYSGSSASGYSGISGYSGLAGTVGTSGYSGYSGSNGSAGSSGFSGYSGTDGLAGTSGFSGYSGTNGTTGTSGFSGYSGTDGATGTSGFSGYSGTNGSAGTSGFSGYSGTNGAAGTSGFSGYSGYSGIVATNTNLNMGTGSLTATNAYFTGYLQIQQAQEAFQVYNTAIGASTVNLDCAASNLWYITSSVSQNWTANLQNTGLSALYSSNIVLLINQGSTGYIPSALQIDGVGQTINWQGGLAPSGNANKKDSVLFTLLNNSGTYIVLGQLVTFG